MLATGTAPAIASSSTTDTTDIWWANPAGSENGWGIQFVQNNATVFATMFVYGPDGQPTWYVATLVPPTVGSFVWQGDLYTTTGSWLGTVPYNPASFTVRKVGTMTWILSTISSGTLTYTVDGVAVMKSLVRQTLASENVAGSYYGGLVYKSVGCNPVSAAGAHSDYASLTVTKNAAVVTILEQLNTGGSCTYSGTYAQTGRMGEIDGGFFSCTDGTSGNFAAFEIEVSISALAGRFTASNQVCSTIEGRFGGVRSTPYQ